MRSLPIFVLLFMTLALPALAGEGVLEINQTSALAGAVNGSLASDPEGFPVVITKPGSYRLTGNLSTSAPIQTAIEIQAKDVTIDLNGFTIEGNWTSGQACGSTVVGVGIHSAPGHRGNVVVNGQVRGMYVHGVMLEGEGCRIERVIAEENCVTGLWVGGSGMVIGSQALRNSTGHGIIVDGDSGLVASSIANNNGLVGIFSVHGSTISGNTAYRNSSGGISAGLGSTVSGNTAYNNSGDGVLTGFGSTVSGNTVMSNNGFGLRLGFASGYRENVMYDNTTGTVTGGVNAGGNVCSSTILQTCPP